MASASDHTVVDETPDDGVGIGESPGGDRLNGDQARRLLTTRRGVLAAAGSLATVASIAAGDIDSNGGTGGSLYGGTMALDKAYKVGPRTYLGPDSAKSSVLSSIPDDEGWIYDAADTEVEYYLDDGSWQLRNAGSTSTPIPTVTANALVDGDDGEAWETLRSLGYEADDYVWFIDATIGSVNEHATTSTTYVSDSGFLTLRFNWSDIFPDGVDGYAYGNVYVVVGSGETVDVRLRDITQNETLASVTGIDGTGWQMLGPSQHTPSNPDGDLTLRYEIRTNPGSSSSSIKDPFTQLGVQVP